MPDEDEPTEADVDAVADEFGGDLRAAIRALLHDLAALAADFASTVSRGYVRGEMSPGADRVKARQVGSASRGDTFAAPKRDDLAEKVHG